MKDANGKKKKNIESAFIRAAAGADDLFHFGDDGFVHTFAYLLPKKN